MLPTVNATQCNRNERNEPNGTSTNIRLELARYFFVGSVYGFTVVVLPVSSTTMYCKLLARAAFISERAENLGQGQPNAEKQSI